MTSVVMCFRWSLKSNMGLICTPSILYDLFGGRYLIFVPSSNFIVLIWLIRRLMFVLLIGLPYPHKAPVASHFEVSSSSPVYLLKRCFFLGGGGFPGPCGYADVVCISVVVICHVGACWRFELVGGFVSSAPY